MIDGLIGRLIDKGGKKGVFGDGPPAAATPVHDHFCDYATGPRLLAANHKNDTDRYVKN